LNPDLSRTILSLAEVSEMTGIPVDTLRYWRATESGGPASYRLGRRVVYDRTAVVAWIDEKRGGTAPSEPDLSTRVAELERLVDLLLLGVIRRGDYSLDEYPLLKRGVS
jgi:predicted DNA-binding transcriptional regulator AlpA